MKSIGLAHLLLVVTCDHDPIAGLDGRLKQFGGSLRWTDFWAGAADQCSSNQPVTAVCCPLV
jgi:hypothetical protein